MTKVVALMIAMGCALAWSGSVNAQAIGAAELSRLAKKSTVYTVESGDTLSKIASKNNITIELVKQMNNLKTDVVQPGQKLKVPTGVFTILVDKSENRLELLSDGKLLKTYLVATGKNNSTPTGTFTIDTKLPDPTWYFEGKVYPPKDPENNLGTRWLGFSKPSYGIHGTTKPETIGSQESHGCVRMHNHDVEELYDIVPTKTKVTIID